MQNGINGSSTTPPNIPSSTTLNGINGSSTTLNGINGSSTTSPDHLPATVTNGLPSTTQPSVCRYRFSIRASNIRTTANLPIFVTHTGGNQIISIQFSINTTRDNDNNGNYCTSLSTCDDRGRFLDFATILWSPGSPSIRYPAPASFVVTWDTAFPNVLDPDANNRSVSVTFPVVLTSPTMLTSDSRGYGSFLSDRLIWYRQQARGSWNVSATILRLAYQFRELIYQLRLAPFQAPGREFDSWRTSWASIQ
jgi:hypothetical protein